MKRKEVAFVTGAASGIGRAAAVRLAGRGAALALVDLDTGGVEEVERELRAKGTAAAAFGVDATNDAAMQDAAARAESQLGPLTTVVACAGREFLGSVLDLSVEEFQRCLTVNLVSVFITARHTVPRLVAAGGGAFVALGSTMSISGSNGWAPYAAAKHAIAGLVRCMALDHARAGVRCNAVLPGFIKTKMTDRLLADVAPEMVAEWDAAIPLGRRGTAEEVAAAIAHLTSDESTYVNGLLYVIDGGTLVGEYNPM
jgi:NAD(P)-dependent dehydrogenase (short-subunit alcohol dehydrogenase family)